MYLSYQVSEQKKVRIGRIRAHLIRTSGDNNNWLKEKIESIPMLPELINQNIIELIGDTNKINF